MKKIILLITTCMLALGLFLYFYTFPVSIQQTHRAVQFIYGEPESVQFTNVYINGVLKRPIGRYHEFEGDLIWEHLDRTKLHQSQIALTKNGMISVAYAGMMPDRTPSVFFLGFGEVKGNFDQIFVELTHWEEEEALHSGRSFLAAPAGSYEEGMRMIQDYYESRYSSVN